MSVPPPGESTKPKPSKTGRRIVRVLVLLILAPVAAFGILSATAKRPGNLGVIDGQLADCPPSPNCVCTEATNEGHRMQTIPFEGSAGATAQRLRDVLAAIPRVQIISDRDNYLHAEATSLLFRYVDDVEFFVDAEAQQIHFRSASRVGRSDFGVNRARMEHVRDAFVAQGQ